MSRKTVCVDLDGVLAKYDSWQGLEKIGDPILGSVEFTKSLARFARVLIYTTRCKADMADRQGQSTDMLAAMVEAWLTKHGYWYDEVYVGQGKPIASAYVDDRSVPCEPQINRGAFTAALVRTKFLCEH